MKTYLRICLLLCWLCWWEACTPPSWQILGWEEDALAQTIVEKSVDQAIEECLQQTKFLRGLLEYADHHRVEVANYYWRIRVFSEPAIDLYAKQCAVVLKCKEEGVEKHQEHLIEISHLLWCLCTALQTIT